MDDDGWVGVIWASRESGNLQERVTRKRPLKILIILSFAEFICSWWQIHVDLFCRDCPQISHFMFLISCFIPEQFQEISLWDFLHNSENMSSWNELNSLNAKLNPICHMLALLGAHHILHVSRIRVIINNFSLLMLALFGTSKLFEWRFVSERRNTAITAP